MQIKTQLKEITSYEQQNSVLYSPYNFIGMSENSESCGKKQRLAKNSQTLNK